MTETGISNDGEKEKRLDVEHPGFPSEGKMFGSSECVLLASCAEFGSCSPSRAFCLYIILQRRYVQQRQPFLKPSSPDSSQMSKDGGPGTSSASRCIAVRSCQSRALPGKRAHL